MNAKVRNHSGYKTPKIAIIGMSFNEMKMNAFESNEEYDDWFVHRDGMRDYNYHEWKKRDKQKNKRRMKYCGR